jgi:hypothetical protein
MSEQEVAFCRYTAAEARQRRDTVETAYVCSYVEVIASGDPFRSTEAFMHRFDSYAAAPAFDLVVAYQGGDAIGQAWGWPLTEQSGWWKGLLHDHLLSDRSESRATLLVRPENTGAYRAYLQWGWRKVAQLRPGWDNAPTFDVLILTLGKTR